MVAPPAGAQASQRPENDPWTPLPAARRRPSPLPAPRRRPSSLPAARRRATPSQS